MARSLPWCVACFGLTNLLKRPVHVCAGMGASSASEDPQSQAALLEALFGVAGRPEALALLIRDNDAILGQMKADQINTSEPACRTFALVPLCSHGCCVHL